MDWDFFSKAIWNALIKDLKLIEISEWAFHNSVGLTKDMKMCFHKKVFI